MKTNGIGSQTHTHRHTRIHTNTHTHTHTNTDTPSYSTATRLAKKPKNSINQWNSNKHPRCNCVHSASFFFSIRRKNIVLHNWFERQIFNRILENYEYIYLYFHVLSGFLPTSISLRNYVVSIESRHGTCTIDKSDLSEEE